MKKSEEKEGKTEGNDVISLEEEYKKEVGDIKETDVHTYRHTTGIYRIYKCISSQILKYMK